MPRLTAHGGSSFEPILRAFQQEDFIALVQQWPSKHELMVSFHVAMAQNYGTKHRYFEWIGLI